ncbi:MAG: glucose-6-phosphate isomerase [Candidatus Hydrogenedentota bacterium]
MSLLKYVYSNLLSESGVSTGISKKEFRDNHKLCNEALKKVLSDREKGVTKYRELPYKKKCIKEIEAFTKKYKDRIEDFVVLGIGGSALGNITLQTALNPLTYNSLNKKQRNGFPRIFILDNVDPEFIKSYLLILNPKKTMVNIISKSGTTTEAMANFLIFYKWLKENKVNPKEHIIVTTDLVKGVLRKIVDKDGYLSLEVPDGVGGRFSVLSPVGLLSAAFGGINIKRLLKGAEKADIMCSKKNINENPAFMNAYLHYLLYKKGFDITVLLPYANALSTLGDWFVQLWAESLGKKFNLKGEMVNTGLTPISALGATDQHSQIQLFNEGPFNKVINFIRVKRFRTDIKIPAIYKEHDELNYLGNRSISELLNKEYLGTMIALTENNRPNCTFEIPAINEETMGLLLYLFEVQTSFMGAFLNIDPYDQPGVENGKLNTYALMKRKGHEARATQIKDSLAKRKEHFIEY